MSTNLSHRKPESNSIAPELIAGLSNKNGMKRRESRKRLEKMGTIATPFLISALANGNEMTRWEAAKALIKIQDPAAAEALCNALMDESFEIQWLAAEALIALGIEAVRPILLKLIEHYDSPYLRQGAHHVLKKLAKKESAPKEISSIVKDLNLLTPMEPVPLAVKRVLEKMKHNQHFYAPRTVEESGTRGGMNK